MVDLKTQSCEACRIGAPTLSDSEIVKLIDEIDAWTLIEKPVKQLKKIFNFSSYTEGVNFINAVAEMSDTEDHHPHIVLEWGKVTVTWWSHKIEGLHQNDFICASKTDSLYSAA